MGDLRKTPLGKLLLLQTLIGGGSPAVERIALGNPLTFVTDLACPLKSLLIPFTPQQEGTGDPSPSNIRSILTWNGLTVFGGGKNLLEYTIGQTKQNNGVDYEVLSDGGQSCEGTATATSYAIDSLRTVLHAGSYTVSVSGAVNMKTVIVKNGAYFRQISGSGYSTFSVTEDTEIGCYSFASNGDTVDETIYVQLEVGQTATAYEPYHPITDTDIVFPALGKNLLPENAVEYGSYGTTGGKIQDDNNKYRRLSIDLPAGNYVFSTDTPNCYFIRLLVNDSVVGTGGEFSSKAFTLTEASNVKIAWRNTDTSAITDTLHNQIEAGQSATAYEPYTNAVYGGTLDVVSGVLTVTHVLLEVKKSDFTQQGNGEMPYRQTPNNYIIQHKPKSGVNWSMARQTQKMECAVIANPYSETTFGNYIGVCLCDVTIPTTFRISMDVYDSMQNDDDSVSICYEIAEPYEITLTPAQINALLGQNTIWSDADGSMSAVYLVSSKYADEHPVGGLGFGFGSGTPAESADPENPDESEEPIIDDSENNQTEGEEP